MLWVTTYEFRSNMDASNENVSKLMTAFAERGEAPGTIAHYVRADGRGGMVIGDQDDITSMYETALAYRQWLDISAVPVLTVEDAVPKILASLA